MSTSETLLQGVVDIHIHTNPDIRLRRLSDLQLAAEARRVGARAIVIKSHLVTTMDRATIAREAVPGIDVFGGIVLNPHVGGLNAVAVDTAIKLGAKIVWLPTSFSANERKRQGKSDGIETVMGGKAAPALIPILKMVAEADIALGTGHGTPAEILVVVEEARKQGVGKIIVNHPEWTTIDMSIDDQKRLAQFDVFFERCYARNVGGAYEKNFHRNLKAMEAIGFESTIVATDGGQVENPMWSEALAEYIRFLRQAGVPSAALDRMTKANPARVLGLS
ncbi:DUF6282 family protein [Propionivibrio soli]|uniref:DUF6282 family protein n=1 Tax=Propionivibrio soli TaxID=2976531 RepID=UPI0021E99D27|nr:DUF6282 family protein [Propionivibrio soli]